MPTSRKSAKKVSPEKILSDGKGHLRASSCIFYIRDPWWVDQFVPIFMPGVEITEPMHGFVFPSSSYERVVGKDDGKEEDYFPDTASDESLRDQTIIPPSGLTKEPRLFGSFAERESVGSCARLRHFSKVDGKVDAVLWINFNKPRRRFEKQKMRELMGVLVARLEEIAETHQRENPFPITQLTNILKPAEELARIGRPLSEVGLTWYLDKILVSLLRAFGISEETGIGSIHLYDPVRQVLVREIHKGVIAKDAPQEQDVQSGQGVLSWVALKRRALLIVDLKASPFSAIYEPIAPHAVSELAVPMLAGDELLGVVNLESVARPCPFSAHSVRTIWYTASQAAIACRLAQQISIAEVQVERAQRLLELAHESVVTAEGNKPLERLAELARDWLQASGCDIWKYSEERHSFAGSGASYEPHDPSSLPRADGWSHHVRRHGKPIWISNVAGTDGFDYKYWSRDEEEWRSAPTGEPPVSAVNQRLIDLGVRCELGMPIEVQDRCVGVAWLKYADERTPEPSLSNMRLAEGFAAQAGLIIDLLQRQEAAKRKGRALTEYMERILKVGPVKGNGLDGYVIRRPCGDVGGDFHVWEVIDGKRTSFLVGDAEGHDIMGALQMIPMLTTFNGFSKESASTKHILWRLLPVCDRWELHGTAICFIVDRSGKQPLLFATSAGHPSLIIFKSDGTNFDFPNSDGVANRGILGFALDTPMGEEMCQLSPGDLIIAYTDGVSEAGSHASPVGRRGIVDAVQAHPDGTPETIAKAIEQKIMAQSGGPLQDDATIMVLRVVQ
ncbi:MAG: hypothetical protein QOE33_1294 [Acidobacteriota bacterium]|nr:hypothetical protein [Acidobacteriota bacterium]